MTTGARSIDLHKLGTRVRAARLESGLTQRDLAGEDFSAAYVSQVERGVVQPSLDALARLAARLDRPLSWLFQEEDELDSHLKTRVCLLLGRRLVADNRLEEAEPYLSQATEESLQLSDRALHAAALSATGDLARARSRPLEATAMYTEAMEIAEKAGNPRQMAACCHRLGLLYLEGGNPLLAVQYLKKGKELLPTHDALEPWLLAALGDCYDLLGEEELALDFRGQALGSCRRRSGLATEVGRLGDAAVNAWASARRWEALDNAERAWHLSAYRQQLAAHVRLLQDGADRAADQSPGLAAQLVDESLAISRVIDDPSGLASGWLIQAKLSVSSGEFDRAAAQAARARDAAGRAGDLPVLARVHRLLGRVEIERGTPDVARQHLEESADCHTRAGESARSREVFAELGELALRQGDNGQALRYFRQAARSGPV